jgi:replicative DNA helicase
MTPQVLAYEPRQGSRESTAPYDAPRKSAHALPHHEEAEKSVLSAILNSPDVLCEAIVEVVEDDFYRPRHQIIYGAIHEMFDASMPVDMVSLADKLESMGKLEQVGGREYLVELFTNMFSVASWRRHAEIVRRDATLRQIISAANQIEALALDAPEDAKEVVDASERLLLGVTDRSVKDSAVSVHTALCEVFDDLKKQVESGAAYQGVQTGYPKLDHMLLGMRAGQMIVIGARPGVGKTSFALNLMTQAAEKGASVVFFSLEMSKAEIAQRLLSTRSKIDLQKIKGAHIEGDEWQALSLAAQDLSELDITIDDTPGTTVTEVRAKARRLLHGKENGIVILDYLQLVSPPPGRRSDSRATEVSEMSRGIKIMAKDLEVPVVALSQLSRVSENRTGKRPQLSDLRESGAIEQDADVVLLLDRSTTPEEAEREDRPDMGITDFIVAKNRSGPTGVVPMVFMAEKTQFIELDRHE